MLKPFSIYDLIIIAVMASVGVAIKPVLATTVKVVTEGLVPGGSLVGGLYMMWIVLAFAITGKVGAATLAGIVQALMVMLLGIPGSHGAWTLLTYTGPGLAVDALMLLTLRFSGREFDRLAAFFAGLAANVCGTWLVNIVLFQLPHLFVALILTAAALSGGAGGLLAWGLYRVAKKYRLVRRT
ncbi:MAG: ECF transporter S component [Clostridiales Family XIII bacterium]|jgi:hypothetical protein|nr:ECF transporter S component [Clostridiales Family XIII bacterium]